MPESKGKFVGGSRRERQKGASEKDAGISERKQSEG